MFIAQHGMLSLGTLLLSQEVCLAIWQGSPHNPYSVHDPARWQHVVPSEEHCYLSVLRCCWKGIWFVKSAMSVPKSYLLGTSLTWSMAYRRTGLHTNCVLQCTSCTPTARHSTYPTAFRQSRVPTVDQVSDLLTPLHTSSRGAGPGSENAASLTPDPLLGTVFLPTFIKSVTPVYLNTVLKLNYSVEHIVASFVSAPGRFVNSAL